MQKQIRKNALNIQDQLMDKFTKAYKDIRIELYLRSWDDFTLEDYDELFKPFLNCKIRWIGIFCRNYRDYVIGNLDPFLKDEEAFEEYIIGSLNMFYNWACDYIEETFA